MMGKGIIIVALGISVLITIMGLNLNNNANKGLTATIDFYADTQARIIANSGVEIYLEKMRRNKTLTGSFVNNALLAGTYNINIYGPDSLLQIKSVASFSDKTHTALVTAKRNPVKMPPINGAIYISSDNLNIDLNGNMDINGNDHNTNGSAGPNPPMPGIAVSSPVDSAYVVNVVKNHISNAIQGLGGTPSVRAIPDTNNWMNITENFIYAADTCLATGVYTTGTVLGTVANPMITYVTGNVQFSGTASGYGIMVVNGNIELSGSFTFDGIIIAYGQSTIVTKTVGNAGVYGSAIFVGQDISLTATGTSGFYYSSQAINNCKANLKSSRFMILSWWE